MNQPGRQDQTGAPAPFVVHLDRSAVDRQYALVVGLWALLAAIGVVGFVLLLANVAQVGPAAGAPLVFAFICVPNLAVYLWIWRSTRRLDQPLVVSAAGMQFQTPRGEVSVPWEAVRTITLNRVLGRPQLTAALDPAAGPGAPGIRSTLPNGAWRTIRRTGLRLSFRIVTEPAPVVARAIVDHSRGRFTPTLPA